MSLRDELPLWRSVSRKLDRLYGTGKAPAQSCPFCGKSGVRVETMESVNESHENLRIGFFTCPSCSESWSDLIQ